MMNINYNPEQLISLLGLFRSDSKIEEFISNIGINPINTVDKEDGADDEFIEFKEQGLGLTFDKDKLIQISLYSGEKDSDYAKYSNSLPKGISFEQSQSELQTLLGPPNAKGGGHYNDFFGRLIPNWIRYDMKNYALQIQFTSDLNSIHSITLMVLTEL